MDGLLAFKLIFSPIAVAAATWLSRRLGPGAGGRIVALPLTSGPISVFFVTQLPLVITYGLASLIAVSLNGLAQLVLD